MLSSLLAYSLIAVVPFVVASAVSLMLVALFFVGVVLWGLGREVFSGVLRLLRSKSERMTREPKKEVLWEKTSEMVQAINEMSLASERQEAFVEITRFLGDVISLIGSVDYRYYAAASEQIWSSLKPEYVLDALYVLDHRIGDIESHDYIRAILPAIILKDKKHLDHLVRHIQDHYSQLHAIQYACVAHCLTGEERLDYLKKSAEAFRYAEMREHITERILSDVASYADEMLLPHLLGWLEQYPNARTLAILAKKITCNKTWLDHGFRIADRLEASVHSFVLGVLSSLDGQETAEAIIFVMNRDMPKEQEMCMAALVKHLLSFPRPIVYSAWIQIIDVIKNYPRNRTLEQLA